MRAFKTTVATVVSLMLAAPPAWAASATFTADTTTIFANPERGWTYPISTMMSSPSSFAADATDIFNGTTGVGADPTRLALAVVDLGGNGTISAGNLTNMQTSFNSARSIGIKVLLRFINGGTSVSQITAKAAQLAPVLKANRDVIFSVQMGMICDFGEWATSCNGLDTKANKRAVKDAVVSMVPPEIPLQVTQVYPHKEDWFAGQTVVKHSGSVQSRFGFHSDCYLTGSGDSSFYPPPQTIVDFTSTSTQAQQRAYVAAVTDYAPFGGETCSDSSGASAQMRTACSGSTDEVGQSGGILNEGPRYHLAHLNRAYATNFHNAWTSGGCISTVAGFIGHRFRYDAIAHSDSVSRGSTLTVLVTMRNTGWARIFSQRRLRVQLVNGGTTISCDSATQLRELPPQATSSTPVQIRCAIPGGVSTGSYTVYLKMPDVYSTTQANAFTIRPANANSGGQTWDATNYRFTTGTTVTVN